MKPTNKSVFLFLGYLSVMKKILSEVTLMAPVPVKPSQKSNFGQKRSYEVHPGVDIPVPSGTAIKAPLDGIVKTANQNLNRLCGGTIDIDYGNGLWSRFCHCRQIDVKEGDVVKRGQVVGQTGGAKGERGAGNSTGPHLHFTLKKDGKNVDPLDYIDKIDVGSQDIPMSATTKSIDGTDSTNWDDFFSGKLSKSKVTDASQRVKDPILQSILEPLRNASILQFEHRDFITPINEDYELSNGRYISSLEYTISEGKKVLNPENGKVIFIGDRQNCKDSIIVQHSIEKKTYYTEFCSVADIKVKASQDIPKNKVLGVAGRGCIVRILDRSKTRIPFKQFEGESSKKKGETKGDDKKPKRPSLDSRKDPVLDFLTKPLRALDIDTSNIKTVSKNDEVKKYDWVDWISKNTVSKNESIKENIKKIKKLL